MDTTQHCKNSSLTLEASDRMCEEPTVISKYLYNNNERKVILPPTGSPTGDSFISGMSIIMLLYFFLMLRSSASPFLNPRSEARKAAASSFYFGLSCTLYVWVIASTLLTILPHFSAHYNNGVTAAALFFPMFFSSIGTQLCGRFMIRSFFYCLLKGGFYMSRDEGDKVNVKKKIPKMIPFYKPFRKIAKSSAFLSIAISILYAHCWSRTLELFRIRKEDKAGAICRVIFTPFSRNNNGGADEISIWIIWAFFLLILVGSFAQDEVHGLHCQTENTGFVTRGIPFRKNKSPRKKSITDEDIDYSSDDSILSRGKPLANDLKNATKENGFFKRSATCVEKPKDTEAMVPWLSLFAAHSLLDIIISFKFFLGRVDARVTQVGVKQTLVDNSSGHENDSKKSISFLRKKYPGCIYDYSTKGTQNGEFWFDFMADCGDGFNSSYQISRLLAQPDIAVTKNDQKLLLPRGGLLVLGGDLAYPSPTEESFEKRLFRVFEDAMSPPPSYRRKKIATDKQNISSLIKGWDESECFNEDRDADEMHDIYKGPSTFIVPGNHDWYDGLCTFTRFILHRDFLGGWLMPQQRSYFAIHLPQGWWIFGLDYGLSSDIDIEQYKFFVDIADNIVGDKDSVILVNHEPHWVTDFDLGKAGKDSSERNVHELCEHHLRGKIRCRLAGDLHHYTRHVPVSKKKKSEGSLRSLSLSRVCKSNHESRSLNDPSHQRIGRGRKREIIKPFFEVNKPELIVSGGGGAFLHGTNAFDRNIKVGPNDYDYKRVAAFPNEIVSAYFGWFNCFNFRERGWRCDLIFMATYFSIIWSLFPLCGIYDDYEKFNPQHEILLAIMWLFKSVGHLVVRIFSQERVSLLAVMFCFMVTFLLQPPGRHIKPIQRYTLVIVHGLAHILTAISCLLFLQVVSEWAVKENIVSLHSSYDHSQGLQTNLAVSIYDEYKEHFYPFLRNMTHTDSSALQGEYKTAYTAILAKYLKSLVDLGNSCWDFLFSNFPLLKATLRLFDLPSLVAKNHHDMCSQLCHGGVECLFAHDSGKFYSISRASYLPYSIALSLYYIFFSIPIAGIIFGTWLSLTLNVFKSQCDLAFSSLHIEHYKNFVRMRIGTDGELQIFAIGLRKVPTDWQKNPEYKNERSKANAKSIHPSWAQESPSKWIPFPHQSVKSQEPHIIDYVSIPKRRIVKR